MSDPVSAVQGQISSITSAISGLSNSMGEIGSEDPNAFIQALMNSESQSAGSSPSSGTSGSSSGSASGGSLIGSNIVSASSGGANGGNSASGAGLSGGQVTGDQIVADAKKYLGVPYVYGGESTSGFDCSGLVQKVFSDLGISVPRTSTEQAQVGTPVANLSDAQPGDLLFFNSDGSQTGHVGIYMGNGQMIDAAHTGTNVRVEPVWGSLTQIRRVVPDNSVPSYVPKSMAAIFENAGAQYGVSPSLLAAVAKAESGFDPNAVSPAGAEGMMQLMPQTAAGYGVNPFDPTQSVDAAAQILSSDLQQFGSVPLALAAYNAGPGAVQQYGGIPPYPETQSYVNEIMSTLGSGQ